MLVSLSYPKYVKLDYLDDLTEVMPVVKVNNTVIEPSTGLTVFTVVPALPTGLTLNRDTGRITGKPSVADRPLAHRITVTYDNGTSTGVAYTMSTVEIDGLIQSPPVVTITTNTAYDVEVKFEPDNLNAYTILASSSEPPLPSGLYVEGRHIKGEVTDPDLVVVGDYKLRAALEVPGVVYGSNYVLANGAFTLKLNVPPLHVP